MLVVDILNVIRQVAATMRQYSSSVSRCNAVLQCRIAYVIACIACDCSRPTSAYNYYAAALCNAAGLWSDADICRLLVPVPTVVHRQVQTRLVAGDVTDKLETFWCRECCDVGTDVMQKGDERRIILSFNKIMLNFVCGVARVPTLSVPKKSRTFPRLSRTLHLDFRDFPVLEILQTQFQNFLFLGLSRRRGNPGRDPDRRETVGKLYPGSYISVQNRSSPTCLNMTRHLLYIIGWKRHTVQQKLGFRVTD